ncbi:MAG: TetR/AcrR family transcriptional regulator [Caulobacteraceae bacterium]
MADGDAPGGISRRLPDKFARRRSELARAALNTLAELGYARTSLREIAQNSEFSHGVLHYYFNDKVELITVCVRDYKTSCVQRYDRITAEASTYPELVETFLLALATTLGQDAKMHRLWYDLRAQALFEPAFRADVLEIDRSLEAMIWRVVSRAAELAGARITLSPPTLYAVFDGLFQCALLTHLAGDATAGEVLQRRVRDLLPTCLSKTPFEMGANAA